MNQREKYAIKAQIRKKSKNKTTSKPDDDDEK